MKVLVNIALASILFLITHAYASDGSTVRLSPPVLTDDYGNEMPSTSVNQRVIISTTIVTGIEDKNTPYVLIIEVRDANEVTVYLQFGFGTLEPLGSNDVGLAWSPERVGEYEVRSFAVSNFTNPQILTQIVTSEASVLRHSCGPYLEISCP